MPTQEELRKHCIEVLGMTEESIGDDEIPQGVIDLRFDHRPLTKAEEEYALQLIPTIVQPTK